MAKPQYPEFELEQHLDVRPRVEIQSLFWLLHAAGPLCYIDVKKILNEPLASQGIEWKNEHYSYCRKMAQHHSTLLNIYHNDFGH